MNVEERLAVDIHSALCHYNHADGCAWDYEIRNGLHDWSKYAHSLWLRRARLALAVVDKYAELNVEDSVTLVSKVVKAVKSYHV